MFSWCIPTHRPFNAVLIKRLDIGELLLHPVGFGMKGGGEELAIGVVHVGLEF